jgi:hypothetical protein
MAVGVGTIAGAGTTGTASTINTMAGDTASATGNPEERGFGPFLFYLIATIRGIASDDQMEVRQMGIGDGRIGR